MSDDIQLPLIPHDKREYELMDLSIDDDTLTPNDDMLPGEFSAATVADIRDKGVIVPIIVVPAGDDVPWAYEVMDGRRRVRACRRLVEAGLTDFKVIPAFVYTVYDKIEAETWGSNINARRSDNAVTDAIDIQKVCDREGYDMDSLTPTQFTDISRRTGLSVSTIRKRMKILDMSQTFVQATYENAPGSSHRRKVPVGMVQQIAMLPEAQQDVLLAKLNKEGSLTGSDLKEAKESQTASRVASMKSLPGFDDLPAISFSTPVALAVPGSVDPEFTITISDFDVRIDAGGSAITWNAGDWQDDVGSVIEMVRAIQILYENGIDAFTKFVSLEEGEEDAKEAEPVL